jgi:hypothetical protein
MSKSSMSEIKLLPPRGVPLIPAQEREAVALLAELLLDAAAKRRGLHSAGAFDGASDCAIGSAVQLLDLRGKAREAA